MKPFDYLAGALLAATVLSGGAASAANTCQADTLSCPTQMPVGGYCECKTHRVTQSGTVVTKPPPKSKTNATAGGCGANPGAPGCR